MQKVTGEVPGYIFLTLLLVQNSSHLLCSVSNVSKGFLKVIRLHYEIRFDLEKKDIQGVFFSKKGSRKVCFVPALC